MINKCADRDATNIHPLYDCKGITAMYLHYYVYAYLRSDGTPYYIGKGSGKRAWDKRHLIAVPNDKSKILILESNLSEIGALAIERRMIRWFGRKDLGTGILHNKTDGGEGTSGLIVKPEVRKMSSERLKGNQIAKNTNYTLEMRRARSIRAIGNQNAKGGKSRTGQVPSQQQRQLNSIKHKGTFWWNNGHLNKKQKDCPGPEWIRGRI